MTWSLSSDYFIISIKSPLSRQRFGQIKINVKTGIIESAYDIEALFLISEMERKIRNIAPNREEGKRVFHGALSGSSSAGEVEANNGVAEALFLKPEAKIAVRLNAPGGSNGGNGHLRVDLIGSDDDVPQQLAGGGYPRTESLLSLFGFSRPTFPFFGIYLKDSWQKRNRFGYLVTLPPRHQEVVANNQAGPAPRCKRRCRRSPAKSHRADA